MMRIYLLKWHYSRDCNNVADLDIDSCTFLQVEDAIELGRRSIYHATHRDAYSGGIINVYHVHENGWTKISADDCTDLFYAKYGRITVQLCTMYI